MNGEVCCILGVCCPPLSARQQSAFVKELIADAVVTDPDAAARVAKWVLTHFDLAPAGSLTALKTTVATLARKTTA